MFSVGKVSAKTVPDTLKYIDNWRLNIPFAKSPSVIFFKGKYIMYYSVPPYAKESKVGSYWSIGIAISEDLLSWKKVGEVLPQQGYEKAKGMLSPSATVRYGKVQLFYQTIGFGLKDVLCHAYSDDGIQFKRNETNPILRAYGDWNSGRASDPAYIEYKVRNWLYFTSYDTDTTRQLIGAYSSPYPSRFERGDWSLATYDSCALAPNYPWEGMSVEAPSLIVVNDVLYMFYSGAFPNRPQQIGVAKSTDGKHFTRISNKPFLQNGDLNNWNYSEVGHPSILKSEEGKYYLFFHGNDTNGGTSIISSLEVAFNSNGPYIVK